MRKRRGRNLKRRNEPKNCKRHRTSRGQFPVLLFLVHHGKETSLRVCCSVLRDVQLEMDSNTVKPLSMIPILCVIFLQVFIVPSDPKTLPFKVSVVMSGTLLQKVSFYCVSHLESLVFVHSVLSTIISEENTVKVM